MTSQAKINANRRNAEKSTGPKTEEGKATVGQNAVTHGLTSRYDVLSCEDPAEYQQHRQTILAELKPEGGFEAMLVERIVSLSWRVRRADRLQGAAMEYLFTAEDRRGHLEGDPSSRQVYRLTSSLVRDCANYRVIERLSLYERRLENSYNKAMAELLKWRKTRQASPVETQDLASPSTGGETEPNGGSIECEGSSLKKEDEQAGADLTHQTPHFTPRQETPCGVTANGQGALVGPKMREAGSAGEADLPCKTNPNAIEQEVAM